MRSADSSRILVDCRMWDIGGAGRVTELLLRGLKEVAPPGKWLLWGPETLRSYLWEGAVWHPSRFSTTERRGQRELFRIPRHDIAIYMHQIRPLRKGPSATFIYDTIQLRYGTSRLSRVPRKMFLRTVAKLSSRVLTVSDFSKQCIERDLLVPPEDIAVVSLPVDRELVAEVDAMRKALPAAEVALYVGRFATHKNLKLLVRAFRQTRFHDQGGLLALVGGSPAEVLRIGDFARSQGIEQVFIEGRCSETRLRELYATSRLLVMPSLEEGFGLPVWEAMCCGLPVCVSEEGSLPEITGGSPVSFPPRSLDAMRNAIDRCVEDPPRSRRPLVPTEATFAAQLVDEVTRLL